MYISICEQMGTVHTFNEQVQKNDPILSAKQQLTIVLRIVIKPESINWTI